MFMPCQQKKKKGKLGNSARDIVCMDENIFDEKGKLKKHSKKKKTHKKSFPSKPIN